MIQNAGKIEAFNKILEFAGRKKRVGSLFTDDFSNIIKKKVVQHFQEIPNVYTQYRPYVETLFEDAMKNKLKDTEYVSTDNRLNMKPK